MQNDIATAHAATAGMARGNGKDTLLIIERDWEPWFSWRPVRLYSTGRFAWLRAIYRRCITKGGFETCEYTDQPDQFPSYHPELAARDKAGTDPL